MSTSCGIVLKRTEYIVLVYKGRNEGKVMDFVVNNGADRLYIQSAYHMPSLEKEEQERRPLLGIGDNFRKMIVVGDPIKTSIDDNGIVTMSIFEFLLNKRSTEFYF